MPPKDNVQALRQGEAPVVKVVASGVSIVVGLADDRQITFQTGFEGDEPDNVVNDRFDRLMRFADRQKARYELVKIRDDILKHQRALSQYREDRAAVDAQHEHQQALRRVELEERRKLRESERKRAEAEMNAEILKVQEVKSEQFNQGLEEFRREGRQGSYVPKGQRKANLEHIERQIDKLVQGRDAELAAFEERYDASLIAAQGEIDKADAERTVAIQGLERSILRYQEEIVLLETKLASCQEIVGG